MSMGLQRLRGAPPEAKPHFNDSLRRRAIYALLDTVCAPCECPGNPTEPCPAACQGNQPPTITVPAAVDVSTWPPPTLRRPAPHLPRAPHLCRPPRTGRGTLSITQITAKITPRAAWTTALVPAQAIQVPPGVSHDPVGGSDGRVKYPGALLRSAPGQQTLLRTGGGDGDKSAQDGSGASGSVLHDAVADWSGRNDCGVRDEPSRVIYLPRGSIRRGEGCLRTPSPSLSCGCVEACPPRTPLLPGRRTATGRGNPPRTGAAASPCESPMCSSQRRTQRSKAASDCEGGEARTRAVR